MTDLAKALVDNTQARAGAIAAFTRDLIAIPTENPPGNEYPACTELITHQLASLGFRPEVINVPGNYSGSRRSIILAGGESEEPSLVFHGHYDVVPADDPAQFEPRLESDRLSGRGAADMKGGVAAMIHATAALREVVPSIGRRIALVIVPDEETGGLQGSGYLQQLGRLGQNSLGMLTPEPTSGVIWHACRGALTLNVTIHGRYAHVGHHYAGVNAFEQMVRLASDFGELKQGIESRQTGYSLASEPDPLRARASILMMGGLVQGGTSFNAVPSRCSFTIERRFNPEEDRETERDRLFALLDLHRSEGVDLSVEVLQDAPSAASPDDDPLAAATVAAARDVLGSAPRFEMCPGLLEIRWYAQEGIPAYAFGPGLLAVSHGPDEYVDIDLLASYASVYALAGLNHLSGCPG